MGSLLNRMLFVKVFKSLVFFFFFFSRLNTHRITEADQAWEDL